MSISRRKFLQTSGLLTAAGLVSVNELLAGNAKLKEYGIQLYTVRSEIPKDPKGVLKQLASYGYKQVESFEGAKGMFWGMTPAEFKSYMDELGMTIISSHCNIDKDFEQKAADAASLGMKYLICPYKGLRKTIDVFKKMADDFNAKGAFWPLVWVDSSQKNYPQNVVGVYTAIGDVRQGPATDGLTVYPVRVEGDRVLVGPVQGTT